MKKTWKWIADTLYRNEKGYISRATNANERTFNQYILSIVWSLVNSTNEHTSRWVADNLTDALTDILILSRGCGWTIDEEAKPKDTEYSDDACYNLINRVMKLKEENKNEINVSYIVMTIVELIDNLGFEVDESIDDDTELSLIPKEMRK